MDELWISGLVERCYYCGGEIKEGLVSGKQICKDCGKELHFMYKKIKNSMRN